MGVKGLLSVVLAAARGEDAAAKAAGQGECWIHGWMDGSIASLFAGYRGRSYCCTAAAADPDSLHDHSTPSSHLSLPLPSLAVAAPRWDVAAGGWQLPYFLDRGPGL